MKFRANGKTLYIGEKEIKFDYDIRLMIEYQDFCVVRLYNNHAPSNNIFAIDENGNILWNISDIIKLPYEEVYVSLSSGRGGTIDVISYSGVKSTIDLKGKRVIAKSITK